MGKFPPHGKYTIKRNGPICLVCAQGPFNAEAVINFAKDIEPLNADQNSTLIIKFIGSAMFTPCAVLGLGHLLSRQILVGFQQLLIVMNQQESQPLFKGQFKDIYEDIEQKVICVKHMELAKRWLKRHGVHLQPIAE